MKSKRIKISGIKGIPIPARLIAESRASIKKNMEELARNRNSKKYDWRQSTFCQNCPIYYVNGASDCSTLMKIEYNIMNRDLADWTIEVLNGFQRINVSGLMQDSERIKKAAENLFRDTINELR